MPAPAWDSIFALPCEELHLTGHCLLFGQ